MNLTRLEQGTNILANAESKEWDVWTFDPVIARRLEKLGYDVQKDHQGGLSCKVPKGRIRILSKERPKRSEKQLLADQMAGDRMRGKSKLAPNDQV